jgi:hypothetical protein
MLSGLSVKAQEIAVVCDEDPALLEGKRELAGIALAREPGVVRSGYVDTMGSQANRNSWMNVLIKMEANRHGPACSLLARLEAV